MTELVDPANPDLELALPRVVSRRVLADEVYEILHESLLLGRIAPGARLNLDRLARELHVSNTPVRQALARLEADGLVTKEPYVGFTASPILDSRTVEQLFDLRLMIEAPTAARAAKHAGVEAAARLTQICDTADSLLEERSPENLQRLGSSDIEFHMAIATRAGNDVVVEYLKEILEQMGRYNILSSSPSAVEHAWEEHRAILEAIATGDPTASLQAMKDHLNKALARLHDLVR
ncbi:GntR family transcriptional regulator [Agromyces sp. NPDC058064]|uniref:GntR family transcriptional regulator n=1 Tax=Agromyces sp. NPDC058064 TaxID=3346322 RepID=UPI0036D97287